MDRIYYPLGEEPAQTAAAPEQKGWFASTVSNIAKSLPELAKSATPLIAQKLTERLTGTAKKPKAPKAPKPPAPGAPGAPAPSAYYPMAPKKAGLPGWVLPVAVVGGLLLIGGAYFAFKKNPRRRVRRS